MDEARKLLDSGELTGAIEAALKVVKSRPTDIAARTFLFELSCFAGDWTRAERQLDAIGHQDVNAAVGSLIYRQCIEVEKKRERLYSDGLMPEFIAAPPAYVMELIYAINRIREGNVAEAREVLDKVEEDRPALTCKVDGEVVEDFRDYSDLTAPVLEVVFQDKYVWLPIEQIKSLKITERKRLRDLFWHHAEFELQNGTKGELHISALYVDSYRSADDSVKLGRKTEWRDLGSDLFVPTGLKLFWLNGRAVEILEINEIEFDSAG